MDHSPDSGLADADEARAAADADEARAAAAATLLVSHPRICRDQSLICSLLQVSRGMRDCISQHAPRGLLPVSLHRRQHLTAAQAAAAERAALQLASWLRNHSSLVGSISLSLPWSETDDAVRASCMQDAITAALQHAAASPPGLLLRSFTANVDFTALLRFLPSAHLTQLEFLHGCNDTGVSQAVLTAQVADILAGLTGLCSLRTADDYSMMNHGPFLSVLGAHYRLTSLEVGLVHGEAEYGEHLPVSLQKLHIMRNIQDVHPMHLAHATALSDLSLDMYVDGDDLPPNVQLLKLQFGSGSSVGPFVALQHLRELHLGWAETLPQADLVQLRDLTALSRLTLVYTGGLADAFLNQAAPAWRQLTCLKELNIGGLTATAARLQAIGSLAQSMECLTLPCKRAGIHLVVDTLRMLTSLTRLSLRWFSDQHLAALPDMPQLRELELLEVARINRCALASAAADLARAQHMAKGTQLTKLVCAHRDGGVDHWVLSEAALIGLRHLDMIRGMCTDDVVPVIVRTMPHLTQLDLGRQVSAEGRAVLAAARPELLLTWW